ncbi:hypothetical protein AOQ84DRAFT_380290 [Glonium stellatum]|uniref:Uncharacterized protein n=1 Tax=Glonium stellatum TaxID=574774 RepID=A0A8E2ETT5_9PEZI|nr:hypothetical protein AOQ84DRAFT_380290 [Glonium stellatum]
MAFKFFTWTKGDRRNAAEAYRTGGLLPIVTDFSDSRNEVFLEGGAKNAPRQVNRPKPPNLSLVPIHDAHGACLAPASALHSAALSSVSSASNLLAVVNDMLRSPALAGNVCPRSPLHNKPLPGRPRSISLPTTPVVVELPGSLFLENQGFPPSSPVAGSATRQTMKSVRSVNVLSPSVPGPRPTLRESRSGIPQHRKNSSESIAQRRAKTKSRSAQHHSPSSSEGKLTTCSVSTVEGITSSNDSARARAGSDSGRSLRPSPLIVERKNWRVSSNEAAVRRNELNPNKQVEELKSTVTAQGHTISALSAQFASLRKSHEAHVESLIEAHAKEVATLKTYTHVLEEQQSQRALHRASSNHLLLMLDTNEPQSPTSENNSQSQTAGPSAASIRSFQTAFEDPQRSLQEPTSSKPEMEQLKRRLSAAKKPDIGPVDVLRDRDRLRHTNQALERQVEALMKKLNQSRKAEKALQNTVDNLEARLEIANVDKVDAMEEHHNLQMEIRELRGHRSLSREPERLSQQSVRPNVDQLNVKLKEAEAQVLLLEKQVQAAGGQVKAPSTIATFIGHIERLQEQVKEKETQINDLKRDNQLRRHDIDDHEHRCSELVQENSRLQLQEELHAKLLEQAKVADAEISELKSTVRRVQKELEYHVLLLQAEIRKQASMAILTERPDDQAARSLASKADVDRMIEGLQKRLKAHMSADSETKLLEQSTDLESQIKLLKKENEFYVREIMYYKLDVRGYKKDIKELKRAINRGQNVPSEANSPNPAQAPFRYSAGTPIRSRFHPAITGGLGISASSSPTSVPMSASNSFQPSTPATSAAPSTPHLSPSHNTQTGPGPQNRVVRAPSPKPKTVLVTPQTPPRQYSHNPANDVDHTSPGISPRSVLCLSPSRTKPTPPSPDVEKMGDMATNFPLSTPAVPQRVDTQRSMSDSIIAMYATARSPDWSPPKPTPITGATPGTGKRSRSGSLPGLGLRSRSGSAPAPISAPISGPISAHISAPIPAPAPALALSSGQASSKMTPERPPRPRYGLYDSPKSSTASVPIKMDVMAEAERHSPFRAHSRSASSLSMTRRSQTQSPSQLPRNPVTGVVDTSKIPFVIAMGSPHNPALNLGVGVGVGSGIGGSMASRRGESAFAKNISAPRSAQPGPASSSLAIPSATFGPLGKGKGKARKEIISSPAFFGPAFGIP